ncbi:MAG: ABC transporter ATP-binding protein [Paludibacteraceae bacterium]|nr:ABC transporter ATP-binding protein [Paludibacteraceae bacterium]
MMVAASHITKSYGSLPVLRDFSMSVRRGEVVCVTGASGSGKTTLLQVLGTLLPPDAGSVVIDGVDVSGLSSAALSRFRNRKIGFVFQDSKLLPEFTAWENILLPAAIAFGKSLHRTPFSPADHTNHSSDHTNLPSGLTNLPSDHTNLPSDHTNLSSDHTQDALGAQSSRPQDTLGDTAVKQSCLQDVETFQITSFGEAVAWCEELVEECGIRECVGRYPRELSGGQQQRVAIARALSLNPPLLLADEPTGNLDPQTLLNIMQVMMRLQKQCNTTIILSTHNYELTKYADYNLQLAA